MDRVESTSGEGLVHVFTILTTHECSLVVSESGVVELIWLSLKVSQAVKWAKLRVVGLNITPNELERPDKVIMQPLPLKGEYVKHLKAVCIG